MTELRTAAVSAVATRLLARPGSRVVAVLGAGVQGRSHIDAMRTVLERLEAAFPEPERATLGIRWNRPAGGFFLAVTVPFRADEKALVHSAEEFGVIWTPMSSFYPEGGGENSLRLSVSYLSHPQIEEGVARFARFVRARCRSHKWA